MQSIDELARKITALEPGEQQALIDKVAQINFQKGLHDLAAKYRSRLAVEGRLNVTSEQVLAELQRIREEVVTHDYPG